MSPPTDDGSNAEGPINIHSLVWMKAISSEAEGVAREGREAWGWFFVAAGFVSLLGFLYAAIISKILPPSDNVIISAIQNDKYYCFLVPLTLPILVVSIYFHWLSMKLFKHA